MAITPLPTPPTRTDPATFAARADAFMAALTQFCAEVNALGILSVLGNIVSTGNTRLGLNSTDTLDVGNGGLVKDAAGNVGVGVTPGAYAATYKAVQLGVGASLIGRSNTYTQAGLSANWSNDGVSKFIGYGYATQFLQDSGNYYWFISNAVGLAAGAPITFTQAMALDVAGNLLVGTANNSFSAARHCVESPGKASEFRTTDGASGYSAIVARRTASAGAAIEFIHLVSNVGSVGVSSTGTTYNTTSDHRLKLNQQPLKNSGAFIDSLRPKTWEWAQDGSKDAGFIAHEFQEVCPNAVNGVKDETELRTFEVFPEVHGTIDENGAELTPYIPAVTEVQMVPKYQSMQASSPEVIANLVAELQSIRRRLTALESK